MIAFFFLSNNSNSTTTFTTDRSFCLYKWEKCENTNTNVLVVSKDSQLGGQQVYYIIHKVCTYIFSRTCFLSVIPDTD